MIVFEQLLHHVERLAAAHRKKIAADRGFRQQCFALGLRQRFGIALRASDARGDLFGAPIPVAERVGICFEKRATLAIVSSRSRPNTSAVPSRCAWPNS